MQSEQLPPKLHIKGPAVVPDIGLQAEGVALLVARVDRKDAPIKGQSVTLLHVGEAGIVAKGSHGPVGKGVRLTDLLGGLHHHVVPPTFGFVGEAKGKQENHGQVQGALGQPGGGLPIHGPKPLEHRHGLGTVTRAGHIDRTEEDGVDQPGNLTGRLVAAKQKVIVPRWQPKELLLAVGLHTAWGIAQELTDPFDHLSHGRLLVPAVELLGGSDQRLHRSRILPKEHIQAPVVLFSGLHHTKVPPRFGHDGLGLREIDLQLSRLPAGGSEQLAFLVPGLPGG